MDAFQRFAAYNFDADAVFQNGLPRLLGALQAKHKDLKGPELDREVLRMKVFYYSKKVAPIDYEKYVQWHAAQQKAKVMGSGGAVCPYVPAAAMSLQPPPPPPQQQQAQQAVCPVTGATGPMPSDHPRPAVTAAAAEATCPVTGAKGPMPSSHPPIASVKAAFVLAQEPKCPFISSTTSSLAGTAADMPTASLDDHLQLTRSKTGMAQVRVVLNSNSAEYFDDETVATLGNHLVECLLDRSVTALTLWFGVADGTQPPFFTPEIEPVDERLEAYSLRWGNLESADDKLRLRNELRLVTLMHRVSSVIPTIAVIDSPIFGVAIPMIMACKFRVGSQRTEFRIAGISQLGVYLGSTLSELSPSLRHYLTLATNVLYAQDLFAIGLVTDFVPRHLHKTLEVQLAAAAACPAPHTEKALKKSVNDLIEAAGPSRLKTFESVIAAVYATPKVTSIIAAMHALPQTAWAETCLRNLNARASHPMIQEMVHFVDEVSLLPSVADQASAHYKRATGGDVLAAKAFEDRASDFESVAVAAAADRKIVPLSAWWHPSDPQEVAPANLWQQYLEAREDFGPLTLLEQPFYYLEMLSSSLDDQPQLEDDSNPQLLATYF